MRRRQPIRGSVILVAVATLAFGGISAGAPRLRETLAFAAEMAKAGNWREAKFRWEQAASEQPSNSRILNNLGVAAEVLGQYDEAADYYERALALAPHDSRIGQNVDRYRTIRALARSGSQDGDSPTDQDLRPLPATRKKKKVRAGGDTMRVVARFSLPPRLDLSGYEKLLVASFRAEENNLLDTNREITRFLRSEFRKRSDLAVADVSPAPPIPEQTLEDLIANQEFWRHLGRKHEVDLIVSGVVRYRRQDSSGYRDTDVISPVTGQKVRETRFVEQEQFTYSMVVFFIDAETGGLLLRDDMQRSAVYPGSSNDPLTAFYGLAEAVARDVLAVISPRIREDVRIVFR